MLGRCTFCAGPLVSTRAVTHMGMRWLEYAKINDDVGGVLPSPVLFCDEACRVAGQHWLAEKVNA